MNWTRRGGRLATIGAGVVVGAALAAVAVANVFAAASIAFFLCAVALSWVWLAGARIWPPGESVASPKLGADPRSVESALTSLDRPVRVGVVGDIQNGISEFVDVLDETRRRGCDALLFLGDCANAPRPARYALLRDLLRRRIPGVPLLAVPGNHDLERDGTATTWTDWVGPVPWRIDVAGWRILGLDDAAGPVSPASLDLLRASAASAPSRGAVLVAHRPLHAPPDDDPRGVVRARARQLSELGLPASPAMTLSGHGHANRDVVDAAGARHIMQGENCDRSSEGDLPTVGGGTLTLGDGPPTYEAWRIRRRVRIRHEIYRAALGTLYPTLRPLGALVFLVVAALLVCSFFSAEFALPNC